MRGLGRALWGFTGGPVINALQHFYLFIYSAPLRSDQQCHKVFCTVLHSCVDVRLSWGGGDLQVYNAAEIDSFSDVYDWTSTFTNFFGTSLWSLATAAQISEAMNFDYPSVLHEWETYGRPGPRPK